LRRATGPFGRSSDFEDRPGHVSQIRGARPASVCGPSDGPPGAPKGTIDVPHGVAATVRRLSVDT